MGDDQEVWAVRDRLPVMRWLEYEHEGNVTDVRLVLGALWPGVEVRIAPRSQGIEIRGTFRQDGTLQALTIEATTADTEVSASRIRPSALITALKEWNAVARDMADQILQGVPERDTKVDAKPATAALRLLTYEPHQPRRSGRALKRGADAEVLLRQVVDAYREAIASGDPHPRKTVADKFGYSNEHIGRLLTKARQSRNGRPALLGPAVPGRAGEVPDGAA